MKNSKIMTLVAICFFALSGAAFADDDGSGGSGGGNGYDYDTTLERVGSGGGIGMRPDGVSGV